MGWGDVRFRVASAPTAIGLAAVTGFLGVLAVLLSSRTHQLGLSTALFAGLGLVTASVGLVVAVRLPGNAMGWCLLGMPFLAVLGNVASTYSVLDYRMHGGRLPFGAVAVVLQPTWAPGIVLFSVALLLFPDGVLPSGRARWGFWPVVALGVVWIVGALGVAISTLLAHDVHVDPGGSLLTEDHPRGAWVWWGTVQNLVFVLVLASFGFWGIRQVATYRRSAGDRRLQLKWLYSGAVVTFTCGLLTFAAGNASDSTGQLIHVVVAVGLAALPLSMGVAILKLRLYEIDRFLGRTLAYGIVTALLIGVYVGTVTLTTRALPFSSPVGVAASTLAAVALFTPLRRRVQRVVDRRFNRSHYDAEAIVVAFTTRLRDALDLDVLRGELVQVVHRVVEPNHVSVWIRPTPRNGDVARGRQ